MNRRDILVALIALMEHGPTMAAAPVLASDTVHFNGEDADVSDYTNTTYLPTTFDLFNVTAEMLPDDRVAVRLLVDEHGGIVRWGVFSSGDGWGTYGS